MIRSAYVPDGTGWMFLTAGRICLGVAVADDSPLLAELWELVVTEADTSAVLDAMTRGGISSAPDFVVVTLGAGGKVLLRGAATLLVEGSEPTTLTGVGFSSWAERVFEHIDRFSCEIVASGDAVRLPLLNGAARAAWFAADGAGVAVFASPTESAPAVAAPPEVAAPTTSPPAVPTRVVAAPPIPTPRAASAASEATVAAVDELEEDESDEPIDEPKISPADADVSGKPTAYDFLFGATSYRTVEEAAVRPAAHDADESVPVPGIEDRTVVASDLAQLRAKRRAGRGRNVEAVAPLAAFYLELSTGGQELIDQPLVIGRAPSATALGGGAIPRLVTMTTPNQDISRTHAQISVEGGTVVVTDLHSSNGTIVTLPGRAAQKLREGETTPVIPGTIIDLGDGATLTVREA